MGLTSIFDIPDELLFYPILTPSLNAFPYRNVGVDAGICCSNLVVPSLVCPSHAAITVKEMIFIVDDQFNIL